MKMKPRLMGLTASILAGTGLALATAAPAAAQAGSGGTNLADLPISAIQNGRVVASTRADARGGFRFDLAPGAYEFCLSSAPASGPGASGSAPQTRSEASDYNHPAFAAPAGSSPVVSGASSSRQALPDHRPRVPGNGGRAGGQALGGGGAGGSGCFPHTVSLPGTNGTTRSDPIPVPIRLADGSIIYALLAGMRTNDAPGGPSGPVRTLPPLPAQASTSGGVNVAAGDVNGDGRAEVSTNPDGRGGRRVDPRIPPPALVNGVRVAADVTTLRVELQTVTVVGTLRLEPST